MNSGQLSIIPVNVRSLQENDMTSASTGVVRPPAHSSSTSCWRMRGAISMMSSSTDLRIDMRSLMITSPANGHIRHDREDGHRQRVVLLDDDLPVGVPVGIERDLEVAREQRDGLAVGLS